MYKDGENQRSKLGFKKQIVNIVRGIIANAKKNLESLKTEINDVKSDHAMSKKNLSSPNNEFIEYLKESSKVSDSLIKIDNDILMTKNEYYVNIKNQGHIINNDMLINKTKCIKLKSVIRENVNSLKNIKNNLCNVKKDTDCLSIDVKKLKEEHINKSNKRVKLRSILINIKVNRFNKRFNRFNMRFNRFFNKPLSKANACTIKYSAIIKNHIDVCTLIAKNHADACTSTDDLIVKNQVDTCTSTDDLIIKNHVDAFTSTDDLIVKNQVDACTSTDDACTNDNNDDSDDKPGNNGNDNKKPGKNGNNDNTKLQVNEDNSKLKVNNTKVQARNDKVKVDKAQINNDKSIIKKNKVVDQVNLIAKIISDYSKNINEIFEIVKDLHDDPQLRHIELNKIKVLTDKSLDLASDLLHGRNRTWYDGNDNINTKNDKIDLVNEIGEVINSFMTDAYNIIDAINKSHNNDSLNDTLAEDSKKCEDTILKMINSSNIYIKQDTKKNDTDNVNVCKKQDAKKNEASINENDGNNDREADDDDNDDDDDDNDNDSETDDDSVNKDFPNFSDKTINNVIIIDKIRK